MRVLTTYISKHLLFYLALSIGIGTFVMMGGSISRVFELLVRDVSVAPLFLWIAYKLPDMLCYTIPMGLLIAVLLLFNRMSAEHEIVGMRASGISLLQIVSPALLLGLVLSAVCFVLQFWLAPNYNYQARWLIRDESARNPLALLEEGVFNEMFPGYIIYVGKKNENKLTDVHIYVLDPETGQLQRDVVADRGHVEINETERRLTLFLEQCTILIVDPSNPNDSSKYQRMVTDELSYTFEFGRLLVTRNITRRSGWLSLPQLFAQIQLAREDGRDATKLYTELNLRAAFALAPFSFTVLAIPFGIQIGRRETSAGLIAGTAIALVYFGLMMTFNAMADQKQYYPHLLVWLPNVVYQICGIVGLWRKR